MVKETFDSGRLLEGINNTLIALIPQNQAPATIKRFRSISLHNTTYKFMVQRLSLMFGKLISPLQGNFVLGIFAEKLYISSDVGKENVDI